MLTTWLVCAKCSGARKHLASAADDASQCLETAPASCHRTRSTRSLPRATSASDPGQGIPQVRILTLTKVDQPPAQSTYVNAWKPHRLLATEPGPHRRYRERRHHPTPA